MGVEEQIQNSMFTQNSEKTFIDKLLAKEDINAIREIVKKERLTRCDLKELLYLLSSSESKLYNYSEWDRYIILKFFVWVREFVKCAELLYDYRDKLNIKENTCQTCNGHIKEDKPTDGESTLCKCSETKDKTQEKIKMISARARVLLNNNERLLEHNIKFLVDLYLNIARSSLSVGAVGFLELLKNKFEMLYPNQQLGTQQQEVKQTSVLKR